MRRDFLPQFLAATLLALAIAGCASVPADRVQAPQIGIADLSVVSIGLFEQRFGIRLRMANPNDFDLPIHGMQFAIELNGKPFAFGLSNEKVTVRRLGETVIPVEVTAKTTDLVGLARDTTSRRVTTVDYRIHGEVYVGRNRQAVPFDRSGQTSLPLAD